MQKKEGEDWDKLNKNGYSDEKVMYALEQSSAVKSSLDKGQKYSKPEEKANMILCQNVFFS